VREKVKSACKAMHVSFILKWNLQILKCEVQLRFEILKIRNIKFFKYGRKTEKHIVQRILEDLNQFIFFMFL
jgi:hypothetical protein